MEADTTEAARARFAVSAETFALLSYVALAALFLIVVSGATVRLTGSGLGCDNWPRCGSSFLPEKNFHALVEYGNRGVGFVVGIVTLVAAIGATRVERLPRWLLWAAWVLPVTVLLQGVLGGITVLVELHPLIVMAHFLLSLLALGVAELEGLPEELDILGFDPQTAGGLLVSISAEKGAVLEASFAGSGLALARIGRVVEGSGLALA